MRALPPPSTPRLRRVLARAAVVLAAAAAGSVVGAGPAAAQSDGTHPPDLTGPCTGSATLDDGTVIDLSESAGVYRVPTSGQVLWQGGIDVTGDDRPISGEVRVHLPFPFPDQVWTWDGETDESFDSGTETWSVPAAVPRNVEIKVTARHRDVGAECSATVFVALEGGFFDSPIGYIAVGGTLLSAAGLVWAARRRPEMAP